MQAINISSVQNYFCIGRTHKCWKIKFYIHVDVRWFYWIQYFYLYNKWMSRLYELAKLRKKCLVKIMPFVKYWLPEVLLALLVFLQSSWMYLCQSDLVWCGVMVTERGERRAAQWKSFPSLGNPWEIFQPSSNDVISQFWESISLWLFVDLGWKWWIMLGQDKLMKLYWLIIQNSKISKYQLDIDKHTVHTLKNWS